MLGGLNNIKRGVSVITTARLHMGFFDLNGGLGRRYGSIGVSLDGPVTELKAWPAEQFSAVGHGAHRAITIARQLAEVLQLDAAVHVELQQTIPEHAGLGSGTQLSLAIGLALSRLYQLGLQPAEVAQLTGRGARSGIGLGAFISGGAVVDGGRGPRTLTPPVISRMDFPEAWRIMLIFDTAHTGVHGAEEIEAFRSLPEFPAADAAELCRHVLMQALPALAEHDLSAFGAAIREIQARTGDHFAPAQGGRYASARVARVLQWLAEQQVACYGQSSWGPTGFAVFANEATARDFVRRLQEQFAGEQALQFMLCKGLNRGSLVCELDQQESCEFNQ